MADDQDDWITPPAALAANDDDWVTAPPPAQDQSLWGAVKGDVGAGFDQYKTDTNRNSARGDNLAGAVEGLADLEGGVGNAVGDTIKRVPGYDYAKQGVDYIKQGASAAAQKVSDLIDSPMTENMAIGAGNAGNKIGQIEAENPETTKALGSIAQITAAPYMLDSAVGTAKDILTAAGKNTANTAAQIAAKPPAPPKIRNYDQIKKTNDILAGNTSDAYNKAHQLGAVPTTAGNQLALDNMQKDVGDDLDPALHPQTMGALRLFDKKAANGLNLQTIDNTRKKLNMIAYDSNAGANDIGAAKQALKSIDSTLGQYQTNPSLLQSGSPDAIDALKDARAAHGLQQQHAEVAQILRKANNAPNKIQSGFRKLYDDEETFNGYDPADQSIIKSLAHPANMDKIMENVGKMGFAGSGNTIPAVEAMASMTHPAAAIPLIAGTGANLIRNHLIRSGAEKLLQNIESRSVPVSPITKSGFSPLAGPARLPSPAKSLSLPAPSSPISVNSSGMAQAMSPAEQDAAQSGRGEVAKQGITNADDRNFMPDQRAAIHPLATNPQNSFRSQFGVKNANVPIRQLEDVNDIVPDIRLPETRKTGGSVKEPSEAQVKAGNYPKEKIAWHGLNISIENPKGSVRRGVDKSGKKWAVKMPAAYGYFLNSEGGDKENVDVFVGPRLKSEKVWVIDQKHLHNGKWDEHKVMVGFPAKAYALAAYRASFSDGKADDRIQNITECTIPELKEWLKKTKEKVA